MEQHTVASGLVAFDPLKLAAFARRLGRAESRDEVCRLDLSDEAIAGSAQPSAVRLSVPAVMVISNLLMGRFREVPLRVRVPDSKGLNLQLARGGFFFAIANRPRVIWAGRTPEKWNAAEKDWVHPFHPSDIRMRRAALVDVKDPEHESWVVRAAFQRYLLSVMHPHRRPARHLRRELRQIAGRWLSGRLHIKPGSEMVATLSDCLEVFYQIVVNIPDHADLSYDPSGCSLGQVYATLGGGRESHNRLHCTVLDNGVGLPNRVRLLYDDKPRSAQEALRDAVTGRLSRLAGGRGVGLDLVRRIADQYSEGMRGVGGASSIRIVTAGDDKDSAAHLEWAPGSDEPETASVADLPIRGTLVWVALGLKHRIPDEGSHQLELTFAGSNAG